MKYLITITVLLLAVTAHAGSYTVITTPSQDEAIEAEATRRGVTQQALVQDDVRALLDRLVNKRLDREADEVKRAYKTRRDDRGAVRERLGLSGR